MIEEIKPADSKCPVSKRKDLDLSLPGNLVWPRHFDLYLPKQLLEESLSCIPFSSFNLYSEIQKYGKLSGIK